MRSLGIKAAMAAAWLGRALMVLGLTILAGLFAVLAYLMALNMYGQ